MTQKVWWVCSLLAEITHFFLFSISVIEVKEKSIHWSSESSSGAISSKQSLFMSVLDQVRYFHRSFVLSIVFS